MTVSSVTTTQSTQQTAENKKKEFFLEAANYLFVREHPNSDAVPYWFGPDNIRDVDRESYLLLGFDTEYKTPAEALSGDEIKQGKAKYEVLSYQFHAKNDSGEQWSGIALPYKGERMSFTEFCVYAVAKGITTGACTSIPKNIILVAHYNRADVPAFDDRDHLLKRLNNLRKSIVTYDIPIKIKINFAEPEAEEEVFLSIYIRDTILLSPSGAKSLAELGKLVGLEKVSLSDDYEQDLYLKRNMDVLLKQDWDLFSRYALNDAEVCVRYFESLSQQYEQLQGTKRLPVALSSIGLRLLVDEWNKRQNPLSRLDAVGKEEIIKLRWIEDSEKYKTDKEDVYYEELSWFIDFVTECYHGGRNEQYWFGPSFEDDWSDFDLSGAYPTAMALINLPKWREVRASSDPSDFEFGKFAFCCVDFEFPPETRYPTLPVRSDNGLIFPLKGRSYCSTPELEAARNLGCQFHIRHGVIIPTDDSCPVFAPYIKDAIAKRLQSKSKIENAFWKEVTNSCYGKTAQGLRDKRVFNIRKERNERLRESRITNPFYAAFITSLVRAVVGEIINAIPQDKMVFSATTDGFITNATDQEMVAAQSGPLSRLFAMSREQLTGVGLPPEKWSSLMYGL